MVRRYAETWAKRYGNAELWQGERQRTSDKNWRQPIRWNYEAADENRRRRVFCASLADVFDNQVDPLWRSDLWELIAATPWLDWLLLTKRPQNIAKMLPAAPRQNIWLGTTVENQAEANRRIPHLLAVWAMVHFVSCEPLLSPVDLPPGIDWVICGGESGPGKRLMDLAWARSLRDHCAHNGVPFFMKQIDKVQPIPPDLLIRQWPA